MENNDAVVLLVGSGRQPYREYLLAGVPPHESAWLLDTVEPSWQSPYVAGASTVPLLDRDRGIPDEAGLVEAARRLAAGRLIRGTLTWDETLVMATAHIAEVLGVPGLGVDGADRCRNKRRTRETLTEAGLPQPLFDVAFDVEAGRAAADRIGFPVVLKPRGMGASIGVVRVDSPDRLDAAFAVAHAASFQGSRTYEGGVLVEELVSGPEISVDGAVVHGEYRPFFLARKQVGLEPFFEEIGHIVDARDPLLDDGDLMTVLREAHRALGLDCGITHTEVRLAARGPVIIEVNARLGGDLIPRLGQLATGLNPIEIAIEVAAGRTPELSGNRAGCAGVRFLYPSDDCVVRSITLPAPGTRAGLIAAQALAAPGDELLLPPRGYLSRYAYLIVEADTPDAVADRLEAAASRVTLEQAVPHEAVLVS